MLTLLSKKQDYILVNWATHQVLSGCTDNADTDLFVCNKDNTSTDDTSAAAAIH